MKMKLKKAAALTLSAVMVTSLIGCGSSADKAPAEPQETAKTADDQKADDAQADVKASGEKVSIVLATNWCEGDSKYDYFYPKFLEFQEQNKDTISISLETQSTEDYKTKIKTQTASGSLPDVFTYWGGGMMKDMYEKESDRLLLRKATIDMI